MRKVSVAPLSFEKKSGEGRGGGERETGGEREKRELSYNGYIYSDALKYLPRAKPHFRMMKKSS